MILFLDDDSLRTKRFRSHVPQASCVATAAAMIGLLQHTPKIALLFLDHDLGGEQYVDSGREDCGYEVVRWLVKNPIEVGQIIVHTCNGDAGPRMVQDLVAAGYEVVHIPFINMPWEQISTAAAKVYADS